jgi:hypothetical protein
MAGNAPLLQDDLQMSRSRMRIEGEVRVTDEVDYLSSSRSPAVAGAT